jgi:hypothetical protein
MSSLEHSDRLPDDAALTKIVVQLDTADWHSYATESLWCQRLPDGGYRLDNVPFLAKGLSCYDVVEARETASGLEVVAVRLRSGHSTYRFVVPPDAPEAAWERYWLPLEQVGCTYERATRRLFAVDVPPETDIHAAFRLLEAGERAGVWTFEEGHCGHPV